MAQESIPENERYVEERILGKRRSPYASNRRMCYTLHSHNLRFS